MQIAGDRERKVKAGEEVTLDAGGTMDPDGDEVDLSWAVYPMTLEMSRQVVIEGRDTRNPKVVIVPELEGVPVSILLTVTDRGTPRLTRYGRVLIQVEGSK